MVLIGKFTVFFSHYGVESRSKQLWEIKKPNYFLIYF